MTQHYTSSSSSSSASPVAHSSIQLRQFISLPVCLLLFSAAVPFTPVAWVLDSLSGAYLVDRFVAGVILLCALYFQWRFSGLAYPVAIMNPVSGGSRSYVSNGRVGKQSREQEVLFIYHPSNYFTYTAAEVFLLLVAEFGGNEYLRRGIVVGVLAALWGVGWTITPESTKRWAWDHIKAFWFFIMLDVLRDIGFGGGSRRGGRARRW